MFENVLKPKSLSKKNKSIHGVPNPFSDQPSYDQKKDLFPGGDYYGTGIKAKVGKLRDDPIGDIPFPQKVLKADPKSLA